MTISYLYSDKPLNFDNVPAELAETYPTEEVLRILGFVDKKDGFGRLQRSWEQLDVYAANGGAPFGCELFFSTKWCSEDIIPCAYDTVIPPKVTPIVVLSIIHNAWESWFSWKKTPDDLQLGKEFGERNWAEQRQEYLNRPRLWADRQFFRFCVSYLDKLFDWSEEDFSIELSYANGQLKLKVKDIEVNCPARGKFNGTLTVLSSRQFFRYMAKRFVSDTVMIEVINTGKALIGSRHFDTQWSENTPQQVPNGNPISEALKDDDMASLKSIPVGAIDEEKYAKLKPAFDAQAAFYEEAGKGAKEFITTMIKTYGDKAKPYLRRWVDEIRGVPVEAPAIHMNLDEPMEGEKDLADNTEVALLRPLLIGALNEDTYTKTKVYFEAKIKEFEVAGKGLEEFVTATIKTFGDAIKPYLHLFRDDLKGIILGAMDYNNKYINLADTTNETAKTADTGVRQKVVIQNELTEAMKEMEERIGMKGTVKPMEQKPKMTPEQIKKAGARLAQIRMPDFLKFCEQKGCKFPKEKISKKM